MREKDVIAEHAEHAVIEAIKRLDGRGRRPSSHNVPIEAARIVLEKSQGQISKVEVASRVIEAIFALAERGELETVRHWRILVDPPQWLVESAERLGYMGPTINLQDILAGLGEDAPAGTIEQASAAWDVFVCHANEDKEDFTRPLAEELRARGLKVWFDEFTLTVGDSLRRSIDRGLAHSRFGVVVISPNFMRKEWPQKELDGLVAREVGGVKVILPVWHKITANEIRAYSPTLADRVAVSSDKGLNHVITELVRAMGHDSASSGTATRNTVSPVPSADVRVIFRGPARQARFVIENWGPAVARDVHFEIDVEDGKKSPLAANDCKEKLPAEFLRSGARVELIAALTFGTGTTFRARWWWREEDGRTEERNEKVSLQSG